MSSDFKVVTIDMAPTPDVLESGKSHFSRVSDALCEFVDNSIQATQDSNLCPTRDINVYMLADKDHGYAIIRDNGCGMMREQLEIFARYSYSKELRNGTSAYSQVQASSVSNISKYGVGAKQAGFYLGNRLHVITKAAGCSSVLEFMMCPDELKERFRNNQDNVYEGEIVERRSQSGVPRKFRDCYNAAILTDIESLEDTEHFTIIVIHLYDSMRNMVYLNPHNVDIAQELYDVYYYHMHPNDLPHIRTGQVLPNAVNLSYFHNRLDKAVHPSGRMMQYFERAVDSKEFGLEIPDPTFLESKDYHVDGLAVKKVVMDVKLLYFPYIDGEFTLPGWSETEGVQDDNIFLVFWQGRLVPETKVKTLKSILPDATTLKQCVEKKIPYGWQKRLKGFLFLDDTFKNISNNKLKITVHSSFSEWLEKYYNIITKDRSLNIPKWISDCSLTHDREYCFTNRRGTEAHNGEQRTIFDTMYRANDESKRISPGMIIQWQSKKGNKKFKVYADVQGFYVNDPEAAKESTYSGTGVIMFRRLPAELYGDDIHEIKLREIDLEFKHLQAKTSDINAEKKLKPCDVSILFVDSSYNELSQDEISAGFTIPYVVVQLLDGNGNAVSEHATATHPISAISSSTAGKYSVSLALLDADGDLVKDIGVSDQLFEFCLGGTAAPKKKGAKPVQGASKAYYFKNVSCIRAGVYDLSVQVHNFMRPIAQRSIKFNVMTAEATKFSCTCAAKKDPAPLDEVIPPISVHFHDEYGNGAVVPHNLTASDFIVRMDDEFTNKYGITITSDPGEMSIDDDVVLLTNWRLHTLPIDITKDDDRIEPKFPLRCTLLVTCSRLEGYEAQCKIKVGPAQPTHILIECVASLPIRMRNGDALPELRVTCRDNRQYMAQSDDSWEVVLIGNSFQNSRKRMINGECIFSDAILMLNDDDIPPEGLECEQQLVLEGCSYDVDGASIVLQIFPSQCCHRMELWCNGRNITGEHTKGKVKEIIDNLTLHFFTRSGDEWIEYDHIVDWQCSWHNPAASKVTKGKVKKNKKSAVQRAPFSPELPPIQLPNEIPDDDIEYEVTCSVLGFGNKVVTLDPICFTVRMEPADAVSWFIRTTSDSIISGDEADFANVVQEVYAVDEFNNRVRYHSNATPLLKLTFDSDVSGIASTQHDPVSIPLIPSNDGISFIPARHSKITSPVFLTHRHPHMPATLSITDQARMLRDFSVPIKIVGGEPVHMTLESKADEYDGDIPVFVMKPSAALRDLELVLKDSGGGVACMRNVTHVSLRAHSDACGDLMLYQNRNAALEPVHVIKCIDTHRILTNLTEEHISDSVVSLNCVCTLKLLSGDVKELNTVISLKRRNLIAKLVAAEPVSMKWKSLIDKSLKCQEFSFLPENEVAFSVYIVTEDSRRCYVISECVEVNLTDEEGEYERWLEWFIDPDNDIIRFRGPAGMILRGRHTLTVKVTHPIFHDNELRETIILNGVSGQPAKLKLSDVIPLQKSIDKATTTILEGAKLHVLDAQGQVTNFKKGMEVAAELVAEEALIVRLKNIRKGGMVGRIQKNEAVFNCISIDHNEWPEAGTYYLVFKVRNMPSIEPVRIEIHVLEDRNEAEKQMEYSVLETNDQRYQSKLRAIDDEIAHYTSSARSILADASAGVPDDIRNLSEGLTQHSIDTYIRELQEQYAHMESVLQQKHRDASSDNQEIVGNLFYLDDDEMLAKILSWASAGYFSAHLVDDMESERAKLLVQQGSRVWHKDSALLPESICHVCSESLPKLKGTGNPTYVVDEIRLFHREYVPLKHKIFGSCILVDNVAAAFALSKRKCGNDVYTRDGYRVSKHSLLEKMPQIQKVECRVISGAQEYNILKHDISLVQKALTKLNLREEAEKRRREVESKIRANQTKLQNLRDMDQLMSQHRDETTPPSKRRRA